MASLFVFLHRLHTDHLDHDRFGQIDGHDHRVVAFKPQSNLQGAFVTRTGGVKEPKSRLVFLERPSPKLIGNRFSGGTDRRPLEPV